MRIDKVCKCSTEHKQLFSLITGMAAQLFNRIGQLGLGVAVVGGVVNSALYNGNLFCDLMSLMLTPTYCSNINYKV